MFYRIFCIFAAILYCYERFKLEKFYNSFLICPNSLIVRLIHRSICDYLVYNPNDIIRHDADDINALWFSATDFYLSFCRGMD